MKKLLFLLSAILITSCTNDDEPIDDPQLHGQWFLTNIDCYCEFYPNIEFNDFKLRFDDPEKVLYLNNPTEDYFYIAESGAYEYMLQQESFIKILGADSFYYEVEGLTLVLTRIDDPAIADDELILTYQRLSN